MIVRCLYVRTYVRTYVHFTSLHTGRFNWVWLLQASHDLTVDLAVVSKLGVDFFEILGKDCGNKRGDAKEEK